LDTKSTGQMFTQVSCGLANCCGLEHKSGVAFCWGENGVVSSSPNQFAFSQVSVGGKFACGLRAVDGKLVCWSILNGHHANVVDPQLSDDLTFSQLSCGIDHCCAVALESGGIHCWGSNRAGEHNVIESEYGYVQVSSAKHGRHTVALERGTLLVNSWGENSFGQCSNTPVTRYKHVSAGEHFTCGVRFEDSKLECWGRLTPLDLDQQIASYERQHGRPLEFRSVSAGSSRVCGISTEDRILCFPSPIPI